MTWSDHISILSKKVNQRLGLICRVKHLLPLQARITLYNSLILPLLDYGDIVWGDKNNITIMDHLQVLQNNAARCLLDLPRSSSGSQAISHLNWKPLALRRRYHRCVTIFKCLNNLVAFDFNLRKNKDIHDHNTRRRENLHLPIARTNWGKQRFVFASLLDWNSLDPDLQSVTNFETFKSKFKSYIWFLIFSDSLIVILIYLAFVLIMFSVLNLCRTSLKTTSVSGAYLLKNIIIIIIILHFIKVVPFFWVMISNSCVCGLENLYVTMLDFFCCCWTEQPPILFGFPCLHSLPSKAVVISRILKAYFLGGYYDEDHLGDILWHHYHGVGHPCSWDSGLHDNKASWLCSSCCEDWSFKPSQDDQKII